MSERRPAWSQESIVLKFDGRRASSPIDAEWALGDATGAGVRVAVIDSGIEASHPALGSCVDREGSVDFQVDGDGRVVCVPGPHDDVYGHGTAVAGIIHALAPDAMITSVRVLGPGLGGKAAAFHAGLVWAIDNGFDIVNLSLGTNRSEWELPFHEACDRAYFGNTFVVTAANNVQRTSYPSLFASVASVACNTATDPLRYHANPNPPTEFLARGIDVEVPWIGGITTVTTGNSFAAPHISAMAALIRSKHPELRPFQIKAALWASAANVRESSTIEPAGRRTVARLGASGATVAPAATSTVGIDEPVPTGYRRAGVARRSRWGASWPATRVADGAAVMIHQLGGLEEAAPAAVTELRLVGARLDSLAHPHIAAVLEVVDRPVLTLVGGSGGSLFDTSAPVAVERVLAVGLAIASALRAAHGAGIVHGDLSLGDLSLGPSGIAVQRTGVAGALAAATTVVPHALDPTLLGPVAPELLEGGTPTAQSDVFALGAVLHRLLTARAPYPDDVPLGRYLRARLTAEAEPVRAAVPAVPVTISDAIGRSMRIDPAQRTVSMALLFDELREATSASVGWAPVQATSLVDPGVLGPTPAAKPSGDQRSWPKLGRARSARHGSP